MTEANIPVVHTNEPCSDETSVQIDLTYLKGLSKGCREFEKEMLESSLVEIEEKMQNLQASVLLKDAKKISQQAHSLKPLCYIIGVNSLYELFKDMERKHLEKGYDQFTEQQFSEAGAIWKQVTIEVKKILEDY